MRNVKFNQSEQFGYRLNGQIRVITHSTNSFPQNINSQENIKFFFKPHEDDEKQINQTLESNDLSEAYLF
ncbi:unnamed protein product [Paramecium sonneborni]|uniref:Uncharacterized protein n=1 Tax=Paramecium sonneborni TaxID=65129 RepID=A0A8S1RDQ6_9CILI|nr:unnamed protein product [Paramecium sonneborni]